MTTDLNSTMPDGIVYDPTCVACPHCDVLHKVSERHFQQATRCVACGYKLTLGRSDAVLRVVVLAMTSALFMAMIVLTPFLRMQSGSFTSNASVVDVVMGFSTGIMVPLSLAVLFFIVVIPVSRSILLIYALAPLLAGLRNFPRAESALRWAFQLKPWAMAEIFMVGVAVALVKLTGLAKVDMGMAFWAFSALVVINALQDTFMCRNTLWTSLANNPA